MKEDLLSYKPNKIKNDEIEIIFIEFLELKKTGLDQLMK